MWYVSTLQQKDSETIQVQQLLEKIDEYENQIEDYKSELDKVNKVRNIQTITSNWYKNMFVCRNVFIYLFWEVKGFPWVLHEENCELWGTHNIQGQILDHIFPPNGGYCVQLFFPTCTLLKIGNITLIYPAIESCDTLRSIAHSCVKIIIWWIKGINIFIVLCVNETVIPWFYKSTHGLLLIR